MGHVLLDILRQRTKNEDVKEYAVKLLKDTNSFEHTRKTLAKIEMRIRTTVKEMGGNDMIIALIDKLSEPFRPLLDNDKDNVNIKVDSPTTPRNSTNTTTTTTSNGKPKNLRKKVFRL
ncbi:Geranylgeranyl pyrophosphate synthase [Spiromyces aspiralis]|uniref:Geranylgeranyl pyrophosphate synthase n=1 Tax=Spiromyces aspiralis TaxID=68401 RepID=A0ACC1HMN1_9FUNG|nr:Geranylgeranyl pyrophosphate synthase [Spiromyces aspiralis]